MDICIYLRIDLFHFVPQADRTQHLSDAGKCRAFNMSLDTAHCSIMNSKGGEELEKKLPHRRSKKEKRQGKRESVLPHSWTLTPSWSVALRSGGIFRLFHRQALTFCRRGICASLRSRAAILLFPRSLSWQGLPSGQRRV